MHDVSSDSSLRLISVHFAKAGGTSLWSGLYSHYGDDIFGDYEHDPCNSSQKYRPLAELPANVKAVHGHIRPDLYPVSDQTKIITFLREPAEKLISAYFFWRNLEPCGSPEHDYFLATRPSVFEFAEQTAGVAFQAYFGGFDMRRFDFVGFHDLRVQHLRVLSQLIGFQISPDISLNVTPYSAERCEIEGNQSKMAKIREILRLDLEFYYDMRSQWLPKLAL